MSKETDTRTPEQIERDEFDAGWDDGGESFNKGLDDYEPGKLEDEERDEGAEGDPPAEDEQDAAAEGEGDGAEDSTDSDGTTRASEDGTSGVESSDAGDGSDPASEAEGDSDEVAALKLQLAKAQKQHNDALSEVGRLKGWQQEAAEKAAKARAEADVEAAKARKAELKATVEAAMQEWGDKADGLGAEKLKPILDSLIDSIATPGAAPVESGRTFTEEQVRQMVAEQVEQQGAASKDVAYANEQLGGEWWKETATEGTAAAKKFDAWLAKQPPILQTAADSTDVRDYVHVMQLYRDASGIAKADAKDDKSDAKGDGVEDEVAKAREVRKAGAKNAAASTGDVRGGTREARDDDSFDAGWDDAGKAFKSEYENGNWAWSKTAQ